MLDFACNLRYWMSVKHINILTCSHLRLSPHNLHQNIFINIIIVANTITYSGSGLNVTTHLDFMYYQKYIVKYQGMSQYHLRECFF